jgi:hypothetical protein
MLRRSGSREGGLHNRPGYSGNMVAGTGNKVKRSWTSKIIRALLVISRSMRGGSGSRLGGPGNTMRGWVRNMR